MKAAAVHKRPGEVGGSLPEALITGEEIERRVAALGKQISADYAGVEQLLLVGVLRGAFIFLADLSRQLTVPRSIDFVALSSYGHATTSDGNIRLLMDLQTVVAGQHVLVVDDIFDTGSTLAYVVKMLEARQPASIKSCVLIQKSKPRRADVKVDYIGFEMPDKWVVGYGLDHADQWRSLPYIGTIDV